MIGNCVREPDLSEQPGPRSTKPETPSSGDCVLRCKKRLWQEARREQLESFSLAPWASRRRRDLLELLDRLNPTIAELSQVIELGASRWRARLQPITLTLWRREKTSTCESRINSIVPQRGDSLLLGKGSAKLSHPAQVLLGVASTYSATNCRHNRAIISRLPTIRPEPCLSGFMTNSDASQDAT